MSRDRGGREIVRVLGDPEAPTACPGCGRAQPSRAGREAEGLRPLSACLHCGLDRLYVQKDFSKKAGLWVFVVAAILSVPTWGLSLLAATIIDGLLYYLLGDATLCYGCGAVHRGFPRNPQHAAFDIHVQETVDRRPRTA